MTLYQKVDGVWAPANMAYVNRSGVQTVVTNAYVKRAGIWVSAYTYDVVPPRPPVIEAQLNERFSGGKLVARWYNVGVRIPRTDNDPDVKRIRLLTTYDKTYPTSQYGGTYTAAAAEGFPTEPWSEWRYNGYGPHGDTSKMVFKYYPRNPPSTYIIPGGVDHYFSAWTEDFAGNWSAVNHLHVKTPANRTDNADVISKTGRFQTSETGSAIINGYNPGELVQQNSPRSQGQFFYGNQINDTVGQQGPATITNAQLYVQRKNDSGTATANIYAAWHNYSNSGVFTGVDHDYHDAVKLGTLTKGEGKWFTLPSSWYANMTGSGTSVIKGVALLYKDPVKAGAFAEDYSVCSGIADNVRAGELYIAWYEKF